jgi:hypothetical protein
MAGVSAMRRRALLTISIGCVAASFTTNSVAQSPKDQLDDEPLFAFVAKGPPNSCGTGCDRWIAVEGAFNDGSAQRFRAVLEANPNLPVYFHSRGGRLREAVEIGRQLRKARSRAGVGRTAIQQCAGHAISTDCRRIVAATADPAAQLRLNEGRCMSACVYAFVGALIREVGPGAHVGVHDAKLNVQNTRARALKHGVDPKDITAEFLKKAEEAGRHELRAYLNEMSIDAALYGRAAKVPSASMHLLTRAELTLYGLITGNEVQSAWSVDYVGAPIKITTFMSFARASASNRSEYRTTTLRIQCFTNYGITLQVERELSLGERGNEPIVRIFSDENEIWVSDKASNTSEKYDLRTLRVPASSAKKFVPQKSLRYSETYTAGEWSEKSFMLDISLTGLQAGMSKVFSYCPPGLK